MPNFILSNFTVQTTGAMQVNYPNPPFGVKLASRRLEVKSTVRVKYDQGDAAHFVGFVQICTANNQTNHFQNNVEQKWEMSLPIVSDSADAAERPWYGRLREHNDIGGLRRRMVNLQEARRQPKVLNINMTDDFAPGLGKLEDLPGNLYGPNRLTRITRDQSFTLWLVAIRSGVDLANDANSHANFIRMAEVQWRYQYDITFVVGNPPAYITAHNVVVDSLTHVIVYNSRGRTFNSPADSLGNVIPREATTAYIANDNQQYSRYVNNVLSNVIVPRRAP